MQLFLACAYLEHTGHIGASVSWLLAAGTTEQALEIFYDYLEGTGEAAEFNYINIFRLPTAAGSKAQMLELWGAYPNGHCVIERAPMRRSDPEE